MPRYQRPDSSATGGAGTPTVAASPSSGTTYRSDTTRARGTQPVRIDFDRIDRRTLALPMPVRDYVGLVVGPAGTLFVEERVPNQQGVTLHKWEMAKRQSSVFATGVTRVSSLSGPDVEALAMAVELGLPAIVAGGIATVDDVLALRDAGAEAAVVGRAALEGRLDLPEALASVAAR